MLMINAIIYIFLSYAMFDQQLKITFRKSPFLLPPPKNSKKCKSALFANIENFSGPLQKGGEDTMKTLTKFTHGISLLIKLIKPFLYWCLHLLCSIRN